MAGSVRKGAGERQRLRRTIERMIEIAKLDERERRDRKREREREGRAWIKAHVAFFILSE